MNLLSVIYFFLVRIRRRCVVQRRERAPLQPDSYLIRYNDLELTSDHSNNLSRRPKTQCSTAIIISSMTKSVQFRDV